MKTMYKKGEIKKSYEWSAIQIDNVYERKSNGEKIT